MRIEQHPIRPVRPGILLNVCGGASYPIRTRSKPTIATIATAAKSSYRWLFRQTLPIPFQALRLPFTGILVFARSNLFEMDKSKSPPLNIKTGAMDQPSRTTPSAISPTETSSSSGTKRKREKDPKFYAVKTGFKPGVYKTWAECLAQIKGFKAATCQFSLSTFSY